MSAPACAEAPPTERYRGGMTIPEYTPDQLRARGGIKWTAVPETLGAFIAEADFGTAPAVHSALAELTEKELFTYTPPAMLRDLREATAEHCARSFGWDIAPAQVAAVPDVITAYRAMIDLFTAPGTPVVLMTPAYMPFFKVPPLCGREIREVPMIRTADGWDVDGPALESALAGGGLLVLCNPHNPIGKVYERTELEAISRIVEATGSRVFADEIHAPLVFPGARHIPYATVSEAAAEHSITALSASKAFNIPGLKCAQMVFTNRVDAARFAELGEFVAHSTASPGIVATTAAYREGGDWLAELLAYLDDNRAALAALLAERLPEAGHLPSAGSYIAWVDLRAYDLGEDPARFLRESAGIALTNGRECGEAGAGHVRINTATPRAVLTEIVERMAEAIDGRQEAPADPTR